MKKIIRFFCIFPLFATPALAKNDIDSQMEQMKKKSAFSDILFERYCNPWGGGIDCKLEDGTMYTTFYCNNKTKPGIDRAQMDQDIKNYCDGNFDAISNSTAVAQEPQQPETDSADASASASAGDADTVVETISVTGTVILKDEETNAPADFAEVTVPDTTLHAYTDTDGKFTLKNVPQGSNIQISYVGQKTKTIQAQENMGTIQLEPDSQMLEKAVVSADACEGKKIPNGATELKWNGSICVPAECKTPRYKLENNECVDQVGKPCSTDKIATGKYKMQKSNLICAAETCKCGFEKKENDCVPWDDDKCSTPIPHAKEVYRTCDWDDTEICKVKSCNDGYKPNTDGDACIEKLTKCTDDQKKAHPNATDFGIKPGTETCIALACKCGYDLTDGNCTEWPKDTTTGKYTKPCTGATKPSLPKNAKSSTMDCRDGKPYCKISECINDEYKLDAQGNKCTSLKRTPCTSTDNNATDATYKTVNNKLVCIINACKTGYEPDADGTKCVAKSVLSEKDSQQKIADLSENADKMHERENSIANKALGAAGMASVGLGGMQMASAMAEKNADADAELAMRAYLSTFSCDYGGGSVSGGTTDNELPGGNELIGLYGEYVNLANNLKARKAALDIRPGIESEPILDSATSGLYDDISDGITTGAYTSLARAIMDPSGADAAAWASRQSDTAQKLKTGAMAAGIGSVATLVGNQLVNSGEENQEKSADINASYEKSKRPYTPTSK